MILDVTQDTFEAEVLERSRTVPVVVDFWAAWCGPCRQLGPVLEAQVTAREGQVVLAKVDVDANQGLARRFGVQGIPAVKAFRDGALVDEFTGAQPPLAVERFLDRLVPSEADRLVDAGDEAALRRALELEPGRADAALALARLLLDRGEREEALALLDGAHGSFAAEGLATRLRLGAARPELAEALDALDRGERERGVGLLLDALVERQDLDGARDEIRKVVVGELAELEPGDPFARDARRRLASALY